MTLPGQAATRRTAVRGSIQPASDGGTACEFSLLRQVAQATCRHTGRLLIFDGHLHNRADLISALSQDLEQPRPSDAELVLAALKHYGDEAPERLIGEFAFFSWEPRRRRLFCARDIFGAYPLHYALRKEGLLVGSTVADVLAQLDSPPSRNESRIADFLVSPLEASCVDQTWFEGILRLPAAHSLSYEAGQLHLQRYWRPDPGLRVSFRTDREYEEVFLELLNEAIRTRTDGVPNVTSMLSGGLDSSTVTCLTRDIRRAQGQPALPTISLLSDDETTCVEAPYIRSVLDMGGLDPQLVRLSEASDFAEPLKAFLTTADDPFVFGVFGIVITGCLAARARGCELLLSGVDGDIMAGDALLGLREFAHLGSLSQLRTLAIQAGRVRGDGALRSLWRYAVRPTIGRALPPPIRSWRGARTARAHARESFGESIINPELVRRTATQERFAATYARLWGQSFATAAEAHAHVLEGPILPNALERYRRAAAFANLEFSHPLLDRRVIEFCLALPPRQRLLTGQGKAILRRPTPGLVPDLVRAREREFSLNLDFGVACVRALYGEIAGELHAGWSDLEPYLQLPALRASLEGFPREGRGDQAAQICTAYGLLNWLRRHG